MNIDSIVNGIVIDHITAGRGKEIYNLLHLSNLDCMVALITNAASVKMGRKDIIKIDAAIELDTDALGYVDPGVTVSIIADGKTVEKKKLDLPPGAGGRSALQEPPLHHLHRAGAGPRLQAHRPHQARVPLHLLREQVLKTQKSAGHPADISFAGKGKLSCRGRPVCRPPRNMRQIRICFYSLVTIASTGFLLQWSLFPLKPSGRKPKSIKQMGIMVLGRSKTSCVFSI